VLLLGILEGILLAALASIFLLLARASQPNVAILGRLPGTGRYLVQGAINRDYTLVMGMIVVYGVLTLLLNFAADVMYGWLDPRVRHD